MFSTKQEYLEDICRIIVDMFKIPVFLLNNQGELLFEHSINAQQNLFSNSKEVILEQLFSREQTHDLPVISEIEFLGNFCFINLQSGEQFNGKIIMGPVLLQRIEEESLPGIINDYQLRISKEELAHYFNSLPFLTQFDFINVSRILYFMLYKKKLDPIEIYQKSKLLDKKEFEMEQQVVHLSEQRENTITYIEPLYERRFLDCIKEGKKEELIKTLQELPMEGKIGVLSKTSQLRNLKNSAIAGITLATRAAIDGGLNHNIAYTLSDLFIQKVEELSDQNAVNQFIGNAFFDFTERVHKTKKNKYSKPITLCQNYIYSHLYEDINLSDLAKLVNMNPNYLSNLFKKEVGISLTEFIQQAKVDEAKNLITYTSQSLTEISTLLNFHDQSYFTKVFKKFAGVTPKQYKSGIIN